MRWGFLGASRIGRRALAPAIQAAGHTLRGVAARDGARAAAFAREFGAEHAYDNYTALLNDPGIDAVYVALPNDAHRPWTIRALAAGKHVLCEKPLALTAREVASMQEAEQRSGRQAMEAFCHIHHPQRAHAQSLLRAGAIGGLVAMQAVFGNTLDAPGDFRWQAGKGGGALYDLGGYCVSLMRVLGAEPHAVSAVQTLQGGVDASFTGQLDFPEFTGQFTCSFVSTRTQHLELIGTRGRMFLDWPFSTKGHETSLTLNDHTEHFAAIDPYANMVAYFARRVDGGESAFGLDWSLAQARTLDALFTAARTGRVVRLFR